MLTCGSDESSHHCEKCRTGPLLCKETNTLIWLKLTFFVWISRLQGWIPTPASPGHTAGTSAAGRVGKITVVWPTVGSPASIPCLQSSAGCTCGQLCLLHYEIPLPQPLDRPLLRPPRIPTQHSACAPTPSIPEQRSEWGIAV